MNDERLNEKVAGSLINFLDQARNVVVDGRDESTHKTPTPSCQLAPAVTRLLPPLIVVSALLGGCNTTGSLPSTGSSEPGADEAGDPAFTLLLLIVADPATPLVVALGFPSKPIVVLLDHAERGVGRWGRCMGRCRGVSVLTFTHKEVLPKRNPKNQKEQKTNTKRKDGTFWAVSSVPGTFSAVRFGRYPVLAVPFGRYPVLAVPFGRYRELAKLFWRY